MAIVGLTMDTEVDFVSELDSKKGTDEETTWVLGTLDSRLHGRIRDKLTEYKVNREEASTGHARANVNSNEVAFMTCQYGLRGWRNFVDDQGQAIEFKTKSDGSLGRPYKVVHADVLRRVPGAVILELAEKLQKGNDMSEEEEGNSDAR